MKKIYVLLFTLTFGALTFGQVLSDDFNYADSAILNANGWTTYSGANTNPIDVGVSNGLSYTGYSGLTGFTATAEGNAAKLDNTGEDVNRSFASPITSGSIYYSFLVNVTAAEAAGGYFTLLGPGGTATSPWFARVFVKNSSVTNKINFGASNSSTGTYGATNFDLGTTYLIIVKYDVSTTGTLNMWVKSAGVPATEVLAGAAEVSTTGGGTASVNAFYLRQYNLAQNITVDGLRIYTTWFGEAGCPLSLGTETATCNAITSNLDTYNVTIPFTGGGTGTYTLSTAGIGTIGGDSPSTNATGNITISNIPEGTNVILTTTGLCALSKVINSPECKVVNILPYYESFPYAVGSSLGAQQKWTNLTSSGDNILGETASLAYTGVTSLNNSVLFSGAGNDSFTPFTSTSTGTIYSAFLIKVSDISNLADLASSYFAILTDATRGFNARLFIKRTSATQYQLGLDTTATTANFDTTVRNVGDVLYIVIGYDFTLNALNAWVNPVNGAGPTLGINPTTAFANLGGFVLRQDDAVKTPTIIFDELRIVTSLTDLGLTLATSQNEIAGLKVYPNPVSNGVLHIESNLNTERTISLYDVLGKQVLSTTTSNNTVNVTALNSGIYIVKITEGDNTATRKLIIR